MNKDRRNRFQTTLDSLQDVQTKLEEIKDEEETAFDNFPASLQESEKGEKMATAIGNLDSALSSLKEMIAYLEEASQ